MYERICAENVRMYVCTCEFVQKNARTYVCTSEFVQKNARLYVCTGEFVLSVRWVREPVHPMGYSLDQQSHSFTKGIVKLHSTLPDGLIYCVQISQIPMYYNARRHSNA